MSDKKEDKNNPVSKKKREFPHVDEQEYVLKWFKSKDGEYNG